MIYGQVLLFKMKKIIHGSVVFLLWIAGLLSRVAYFILLASWHIFLFVANCLIAAVCLGVYSILRKTGFTLSVTERRNLIRVLRRVPLRKTWREIKWARQPVSAKPFAINLRETDPYCFIGMKLSEVSTILRVGDYEEWGGDRGERYITWRRVGFEVQCSFYSEVCACCSFYIRSEQGGLTEISRTI